MSVPDPLPRSVDSAGDPSGHPTVRGSARTGLIIVAAGVGSRLGAGVHKALVQLDDRPLVEHTLRRLLDVPALDPVVLVGHADDRAELSQLVQRLPRPVTLVDGGARRQDSVAAGLDALGLGDGDLVLVHDAARPFVPLEALAELIDVMREVDCALLASPVADTLKAVDPGPPVERPPQRPVQRPVQRQVQRTVPRDGLWAAQTPQAFRMGPLRELLAQAARDGRTVTDEAGLFEHAGRAVRIVEGSRINFKITTNEDLALARALLAQLVDRVGTVQQREERAGS